MRTISNESWFPYEQNKSTDIMDKRTIKKLRKMYGNYSYTGSVDCCRINPYTETADATVETVNWTNRKITSQPFNPIQQGATEIGLLLNLDTGILTLHSHGMIIACRVQNLRGNYTFFVQMTSIRPLREDEEQPTITAATYE
jgi:hypothetical protein